MDSRLAALLLTLQLLAGSVTYTEITTENTQWTPIPPHGGWFEQHQETNVYQVCSHLSQPVWLRSNQIEVAEANAFDITVEYTISSCSGLYANCIEYFDFFVYHLDQCIQFEDKYPDPRDNNTVYEKVAVINTDFLGPIKSKVIHVILEGKCIFLAFRNSGACSIIYSANVTYNVCPGGTLSNGLLSLKRTVAPANESDTIRVEGNCAADAVNVLGSFYVECKGNGEWNMTGLENRCLCKENMENVGGKCQDCPVGKYNDQKGLNCTVLPSAPENITATFVNQSSVELRWHPPSKTSDRGQVFYDVICLKSCNIDDGKKCVDEACRNEVHYIPNNERLNLTQLLVVNLFSFVNYSFKIYARNQLSEWVKSEHGGIVEASAEINVTTLGSVPGKPEVSVKQTEGTVSVSWILQDKNGVVKNYHLTYIRDDDTSDTRSHTTKEMKQNFKNLKDGKTYEFQVYAVNNFGKGPAGVKKFTLGKGGTVDKLVVPLSAAGGGLVFILLVVIIIVIFVLRRRKRSVDKAYMRSIEQGGELDQRRYIDPANYADLMDLLSTFSTEIARSKTKLEGLIGQGEFADVYKGTLKTEGRKDIVAVKVLRPGSSEESQKDFLSEASIVAQFYHPNVIKLVGVVTQSRPMMILTEFLESGSLDHFLKSREGNLTSLQLVGMARGVACGMVYLSEMSFIHRDLAARNILVGENMSCKVSDFGLSRELLSDNKSDVEYETQGGKIAVRWTAPEALQHRKFSTASDVWSYGIVLWEIMSFSDRPYWDWTNVNVIKRVTTGYRLPAPKDCPKVVHSLMMDCWESDKNKRPKFTEIVSRLDEIIRSSQVLRDVVQRPETTSVKHDVPEFESVEEWLQSINMENYFEMFEAANIDNLEEVTKLEEQDLEEMGVKLIGHRNKMNKSIKSMKAQSVNRGLAEDEAAI